ncbi:NADH/NADPH-dependent indole-3-acetaldehyde reductase [Aspergillus japonicus CBS 114.51]|uniref:D-xylose reductase [NAD(P)H] n=2 Tax=Aspergillus TaxID=5052 RepID=A0A2V5H3D5_ASPV1|nr:NADH/NADPH-dependent indole-3-acetaldehyde reductase [Aspergillus japonicus CBS 114.51]PYI16174.1 NADH/NADPH-dependent indole-3-acetaldehyde reductase [Aspergillus violaceofuscus CBS 115571]RAH77992.1 NADH/NADPH-dependent indole-3-acetaldehyde reductase [Aspergillus japonicus CBS 114.51]
MASTARNFPFVRLGDGIKIPLLGYGSGTAWYKKTTDESIDRELVNSIKTAIRLGYRHLDGAEVYGTEPELGLAIKESGVIREDLFVTTKVNTNIADIPGAIDLSLRKLQLSYVDLYKAWAVMERVKAAGKARSIGVSNFLQEHLEAILSTATTLPSINQVEFHPYLQHGNLLEFHRDRGIRTASYGPLTPINRARGGPLDQMLSGLAKKYAVGEGEILLRWVIDCGSVAITTSSKESRLSSYLRALTFKLTPKEVNELSRLGQKAHFRAFWRNKFAPFDHS